MAWIRCIRDQDRACRLGVPREDIEMQPFLGIVMHGESSRSLKHLRAPVEGRGIIKTSSGKGVPYLQMNEDLDVYPALIQKYCQG